MMAPAIVAPAAAGSITIPYQLPAAVPDWAWNVTGLATLPLTFSVPLIVSSTWPVSIPAACPSVAANWTTVPAWMVRDAPAGTVTSPWTMYGLPAGVQVWLMTLPPVTVVCAPAGRAVRRQAAVAAAANTRRVARAMLSLAKGDILTALEVRSATGVPPPRPNESRRSTILVGLSPPCHDRAFVRT